MRWLNARAEDAGQHATGPPDREGSAPSANNQGAWIRTMEGEGVFWTTQAVQGISWKSDRLC